MNFIAQVEEHLRDLGTEARKKHPGVKEASERAILQLRSLQNAYVTAVRKATQTGGTHPTTELFRSQDLLRPFLLAANYPNASPKLLEISLSAMSLLIEGNAICPGDGIHMVRVWTIQAHVCASALHQHHSVAKTSNNSSSTSTTTASSSWFGGMLSSSSTAHDVSSSSGSGGAQKKESVKIALELLSCLIQLLELRDLPVTDEQWASSVTLCCILWDVEKSATVRQAAHSTLHQVLGLLFEKESPVAIDTWKDLLQLASSSVKELKGAFSHCTGSTATPPAPSVCLELMHKVLSQSSCWLFDNQVLMDPTLELTQLRLLQPGASLEITWRSFQLARVFLTASNDSGSDLMGTLVSSIVTATEACRTNHDFEDGFVYTNQKEEQKPKLTTLIPDALLWKAGLALETLFAVLSTPSTPVLKEETVVVSMAEAISDFATIGASCRDHMLQLVECAEKAEQEPDSIRVQPTIFRNAEEVIKSKAADDNAKSGMGEALWTAFHCILQLASHKQESSVEGSFAPSLAVFQHYLKRFPGSSTIVHCTLEGYLALARLAIPDHVLLRKALLSSLCKLSLPSWGKHDSSCQLQDHHVEALICLLKIIHQHCDSIHSDWNMVLWTFQELSILNISSPLLSEVGYANALAVSSTFARIAPLTACLSLESLTCVLNALADVSTMVIQEGAILTDETSRPIEATRPRSDSVDVAKVERRGSNVGRDTGDFKPKDSIGGKLMSFAGRTLYGSQTQDAAEDTVALSAVTPRTKNTYFGSYRQDFLRRLLSSKRAFGSDVIGKLPFSLVALSDAALANTFRYDSCGTMIANHFCSLAATSPEIRSYAMDTLAMLISSQLSTDVPKPVSFSGPGRISIERPMKNQYLVVEATNSEEVEDENDAPVSQADMVAPLCVAIRKAEDYEVAEAGISALNSILEGAGHNMTGEVWTGVIVAITSLSGDVSKDQGGIDRSGADWSTCGMLAFRCLKLVVDDFLDRLPPPCNSPNAARTTLLDCCSSFGSSRHDVNTSLTAIGLLWSIADQDSNSWSIDRALSELVFLSSDDRTEVRNCAVNTLFSCIVGRGQGFTAHQWEACISQTIFDVYDSVLSRGGTAGRGSTEVSKSKEGGKKTRAASERYRVSVHHSRDSAGKQWATTQVIVLQGLSRVLRNFFPQLLDAMDSATEYNGDMDHDPSWFQKAWTRMLDFALAAAKQSGSRETLDLRSVGVDLLVQCSQLSCQAGIQASITPAKVGTNMEVIDGALRNVDRSSVKSSEKPHARKTVSVEVDQLRQQLFLTAFDALDEFRDHLENEALGDAKSKPVFMETVQVQVLHKLSLGLGKLYECCKDDEFAPERASSTQQQRHLEPNLGQELHKDDLEGRFVNLIAAIARNAVSDPNARFLTQAQRTCLELLQLMSSQSSEEALRMLATMGSYSFFWTTCTETDGEDMDCEDDDISEAAGPELVSHAAAKAVAEEMPNKTISDEAKVQILYGVLPEFTESNENESEGGEMSRMAISHKKHRYTLFVPVVESGLGSAAKLEESLRLSASDGDRAVGEGINHVELLDQLWEKMLAILSQLLAPDSRRECTPRIAHAVSLIGILNSVVSYAPEKHHDSVCALLSSGASSSVKVARLQTANANDDSKTAGEKERSQTRRGDALKVFDSCFSGLCAIQPQSRTLESLTRKVLEDVLEIETCEEVPRYDRELFTDVGVIALKTIARNDRMERLVIGIFSLLCKLISVDHSGLRGEVSCLLGCVDVGRTLEDATRRCEKAETRAQEAEEHIHSLEDEIDDLRDENESLQQQILVYSTSSALT